MTEVMVMTWEAGGREGSSSSEKAENEPTQNVSKFIPKSMDRPIIFDSTQHFGKLEKKHVESIIFSKF